MSHTASAVAYVGLGIRDRGLKILDGDGIVPTPQARGRGYDIFFKHWALSTLSRTCGPLTTRLAWSVSSPLRLRTIIGALRASRAGLSSVEPSLKQQNPDIRNSRPETREQELRKRLENGDFPAAETD